MDVGQPEGQDSGCTVPDGSDNEANFGTELVVAPSAASSKLFIWMGGTSVSTIAEVLTVTDSSCFTGDILLKGRVTSEQGDD